MTVLRNGNEQEITATLAKRPIPKFGDGSFAMPGNGQFDLKGLPDMKNLPQFRDFPAAAGLSGP